MTFQAYHRARRMGLALADIRKGKTVTDSQLDQGFESGSGFREAFTRIVGTAPSRARDVTVLHAKWLETPLGSMLALADDRGLHLLDFVDRRGLERALAVLQKRLNARVLPGEHPVLAQIARELTEYFDGTRMRFDTPVVLTGSAFQSSVWRALQSIPAGATNSYGELAARIGQPTAVRAVGRANGDNRLSIIVPCHRVIGADGALTGYGGGLWRKQKLLDHERAAVPHALMSARSLALLTTLAALWGGSFVFMRYAVPAMGPVPLTFARVALAALVLFALAAARRKRARPAIPLARLRHRRPRQLGAAVRAVLLCRADHQRVDGGNPQRDEPVLRRRRGGDLAGRAADGAQDRRHDAGTRRRRAAGRVAA